MKKILFYKPGRDILTVRTPAIENAINDATGEWLPLKRIDEELPEGFRLVTAEDVAKKEGLTEFKIVDESELPQDVYFRNAWTFDGVDMEKAKQIHLDRMRAVRASLLEKLDIEFIKALESGEEVQEIIQLKKQLRDVTKIDLSEVSTPEELKALWPDCLE